MMQKWFSQDSAKFIMSFAGIPLLFGGETKLNVRRKLRKEGKEGSFPKKTKNANSPIAAQSIHLKLNSKDLMVTVLMEKQVIFN